MKIIDRIEIKNFRSFGNRTGKKVEIIKINDVNIFSGANDSGKSNVLRALNLFFNQNTNNGNFLDFSKDFFKKENTDEKDIKEKMITIKIHFINIENNGENSINRDKVKLPREFWVSRKWLNNSKYSSFEKVDGVLKAFEKEKKRGGDDWFNYFLETDGTVKKEVKASLARQLTNFLSSIHFYYIPAIKDSAYFYHLYGDLQKTLLKENNSGINNSKNAFQSELQKDTDELMNDFKSVSKLGEGVELVFNFPDLISLFQNLGVDTGKVDIRYRGDGIQAKLIPEILHFISLKEKKYKPTKLIKGEKVIKYPIWGFEEPENSYEYKNAQLLADRIKDVFSKSIQIFITTHSFNFISLEGDNISKYRVKYDNKISSSKIVKIIKDKSGQTKLEGKGFENETYFSLQEELGVFDLNDKLKIIYNELEEEKRVYSQQLEFLSSYKEVIENTLPTNIFICEDAKGIILWEKFFNDFGINNVSIFPSNGCTKYDIEIWIIQNINLNPTYKPKIYRSLDRDGFTNEQCDYISNESSKKYEKIFGAGNYSFKFLPVNEIENFAILSDDYFTDQLINDNEEKLENSLLGTIQPNFNKCSKKYPDSELFEFGNSIKIINGMRREADKNKKKYYPGKDIKKLKEHFDIENYLLTLDVVNYPTELKSYLESIKSFFEE